MSCRQFAEGPGSTAVPHLEALFQGFRAKQVALLLHDPSRTSGDDVTDWQLQDTDRLGSDLPVSLLRWG